VIRLLGVGGGGSVYLARDLLEDGRKVALKVARGDVAQDLIQREFRILREVCHPSIARAFDCGRLEPRGRFYLTLEYVAGPNLEELAPALRREALRGHFDRCVDVFFEIAEALEYLHSRGFLHLDLKPSNIVLAEGRAKLIDFGIFQTAGDTSHGVPRGTALFAAPELLEGKAVDARSDLYSLGVTLYHVLTGDYPVRGSSVAEILARHCSGRLRLEQGIPPPLRPIVERLILRPPNELFSSAAEVGRALAAVRREGASHRQLAPEALDFAGRRRELGRILSWIEALHRTPGLRVLVIRGDAGAGKTRLVHAAETELLVQGLGVLSLRCGSTPSGEALRGLVEKLLRLGSAPLAERARYRFLLGGLGLTPDAATRREIERLSVDEIRTRFLRDFLELARELARGPLVIVLEDFHLADSLFVDFVRRLCRASSSGLPLPLGLLLTTRRELSWESEARPAGGSPIEAIVLGPLRREDVLRALRSHAPFLPRDAVPRLAALSRGSPGVLARLVQGVVSGAAAGEGNERGKVDLRTLLQDELRRLDARQRSVLAVLSLASRPLRLPLLAAVTGLSGREVGGALDSLRKLGVVAQGRLGQYVEQDLRSDLALEGTGRRALRRLHEDLGMKLLGERDALADAARHLLRGGRVREGLDAARRAVEVLGASGRVEEAQALCLQALQAKPPRSLRCALLESLSDCQLKGGQFHDAERSLKRTLAERQIAREDRLRLERKLGAVYQRAGRIEDALRTFQGALALADDASDLDERLSLLGEVAALRLFVGDYARADELVRQGLDLLSRGRTISLDAAARAHHGLSLHSVAGNILLRKFDYSGAAREFLAGLKHARRLALPASAALLLNNLGIAYHQSNRVRKSLSVYRQAAALAGRLGDETTLFSIRCNVAGVRARLGEVEAARAILAEIEAMPHWRSSRRGRLFLLHTRALLERLALRDAGRLLRDGVRLADELSDPLYAGYLRLYLTDNEIQFGRWRAARRLLEWAETSGDLEPRLRAAFCLRSAWLHALCGDSRGAREALEDSGGAAARGGQRGLDHGDLWDLNLRGLVLMELGAWDAAEENLRMSQRLFARSGQATGELESLLLLGDLELRRRRPDRAGAWLRTAREALAKRQELRELRGVEARLPFLEARLALEDERARPSEVLDLLAASARNVPGDGCGELRWWIELVRVEAGDEASRKRLARSLERFAASLALRDRERYLERDHHARLGLGASAVAVGSATPGADAAAAQRLSVLHSLLGATEPREALDAVLRTLGAKRGAVFLDDGGGRDFYSGADGGKGENWRGLRADALRVGGGRLGRGLCAPVEGAAGSRIGVLYVEPAASSEPERAQLDFLELAARVLASAIPQKDGAASMRETAAQRVTKTRTQTLPGALPFPSRSAAMVEVLQLMQKTRDSDLPLLLLGESGVGKDYLARWIHQLSPRREKPFVSHNCAATPAGLLEADLFGYEAGAFTGASADKRGYLLEANGGTFYLDGIDSLEVETQAKLLRVLEERKVRPLGSTSLFPLDVRIISSSQRDPLELVEERRLRRDLYFRLSGIQIAVPPLRERVEDIPLLVKQFRSQLPSGRADLSAAALEVLQGYSWPGNVRELETLVRRLALTAEDPIGKAEVLRALGIEKKQATVPRWIFEGRRFRELVEDLRREYLRYAFERCGGDVEKVARQLGTTRRNVYLRLAQLGLKPAELRSKKP
jgi:DNA-binding NtrC family response regulator/tetratricopeptide (TPR) repeat protein/predicted Ser/Thr protein kinase